MNGFGPRSPSTFSMSSPLHLIVPQRYRLSKLATMAVLPTDPADGLEVARVRSLKLLPPNDGAGTLIVEAPADQAIVSAPGLSNAWFAARDPLRRGFYIVEGTISFHFYPVNGRKTSAIHLDLGLATAHRTSRISSKMIARVVEKHLVLWGLVRVKSAPKDGSSVPYGFPSQAGGT